MLKKDVLDYIDNSGSERSGSSTILAEILGVTGAAVSQWIMLPREQAKALHKLLRLPIVIKRYGLIKEGKPVFKAKDYDNYDSGVLRRQELRQLKRLSEKYNSDEVNKKEIAARKRKAKAVLERADRQKTLGNKVAVLTTFIKKLIK